MVVMFTLVISLLSWEKCSNLFWPFSIGLWNCGSVRLLGKAGSPKLVSRGLEMRLGLYCYGCYGCRLGGTIFFAKLRQGNLPTVYSQLGT